MSRISTLSKILIFYLGFLMQTFKEKRDKLRAYAREYYKKNKDNLLFQQRRRNSWNRERSRLYLIEWRRKNPDYYNNWKKNNPDKIRMYVERFKKKAKQEALAEMRSVKALRRARKVK